MTKILIIGKKSFIGSNLYKYFKHKTNHFVNVIDFNLFKKKKENYIKKFDYLINCSSNKKYLLNKYNKKNDHDFYIAKKLVNTKVTLIFLSTRKVYRPKFNIKETDKLRPSCTYSKNKLKTEINLKKILHRKKLLIFRISNVIGFSIINQSRKLHFNFIDHFFSSIKKNYIYENGFIYKDFISIEKMCEIINISIKKKIYGIYNLSLGKKIYLNTLIKWLNFYNNKKIIFKKQKKYFNKDSFTLNNNKLLKTLRIKNKVNDLKLYCIKLSKQFFKKR